MLEIAGHISLQDARLALAKGAAAIDKLLRDVPYFGDVKVGRDLLTARQDEAWKGLGMRAEDGFQLAQFHDRFYMPVQECNQASSLRPQRAQSNGAARLRLIQIEISQTQRIGDHRNGAQAHRGAGDNRAEENAEPRIKNAGGDRHA
jgi:hypothetical protein